MVGSVPSCYFKIIVFDIGLHDHNGLRDAKARGTPKVRGLTVGEGPPFSSEGCCKQVVNMSRHTAATFNGQGSGQVPLS